QRRSRTAAEGAIAVNRDRRIPARRPYYPLRVRRADQQPTDPVLELDSDDIAPWIFEEVRTWPAVVDDRVVARRVGVHRQHVRTARRLLRMTRPAQQAA